MKLQNFNAKYGENIVFSNFNIEVLDGQITCILGNSGAGKTTLIKGFLQLAQRENKSVAVVFQENRLFEHLTVYENLKLISSCDNEIKNALIKVGLESKTNAYPNKLSGGEKQRVNIVRALLSDSEILLLDEPFSSLDIKLKRQLIKLILSNKGEKTIIFVTHDIDEALMFSNKIYLLKQGKIALEYQVFLDFDKREYGKMNFEREVLLNAQLN